VEFQDSPEEAAFRAEVRSFIQEHFTDRMKSLAARDLGYNMENASPDQAPLLKEWRQALASRGWITPHWPKEYGGAGMTPIEQFIFNEEMSKVRAPTFGGSGVGMLGPTLIIYGTEEQKKEHLPGIASGEVVWCQGYSEPGSGSDLASLQTRAVRDGDEYVINGQKIWTSGAHRADWMFMLARTDPDAPKHRGISMFLLDMKTPGITVRPLINMAGDHGFNEDFFDNVRVPAKNRVGEENRGWYIGATLLDFERSGIGAAVGMENQIEDLVSFIKENRGSVRIDPVIKQELAERRIEAAISRMFSYRIISMQKRGQVPNYEASVSKNFRSESGQRLAQTQMKLIGLFGNLWDNQPYAPNRGRYPHQYVSSVSGTIAAGTSEINRNVIATRGLGLPRG
jgi:alkylation response protein AidB-like acyl-CoA dehydrogenase